MRTRFIRFWASLMTTLGCLALVAGVVAGVVVTLLQVGSSLGSRSTAGVALVWVLGAVAGFLAGAIVGVPLVAIGQGLRLLLRQNARLARIERRLRASASRPPTAPPVVAPPAIAPSSPPAATGTHSLADRLRIRR